MAEIIKEHHDNMQYLESIIVMYHKAVFILENYGEIKHTTLVNEQGSTYYLTDDSLKGYINLKEHVDYTIGKLDPFEKEFMNNEFFNPSNTSWWAKLYSKSTYYRVKNNTIRKFLRLYQL